MSSEFQFPNPFPTEWTFETRLRDRRTGVNGKICSFSFGRFQTGVWVEGVDLNDRPFEHFINLEDAEVCGDD